MMNMILESEIFGAILPYGIVSIIGAISMYFVS